MRIIKGIINKKLAAIAVIILTSSINTRVFATNQVTQGIPSVLGIVKNSSLLIPMDIYVSIPTNIIFNVSYNNDKQKAELTSADYTITNNGENAINVMLKCEATDTDGVTFTSPNKVKPKDSNLEIALSLNIGKDINPTTPWIQNFTDNTTGNFINIVAKGIEHMQFSSTDQGLANITQHAKDGKLAFETNFKGNLIFIFSV